MSKAYIKLPDGTSVTIEGSPEEVAKVLSLYGGAPGIPDFSSSRQKKTKKQNVVRGERKRTYSEKHSEIVPDLAKIINVIKNCDEAEAIEATVLDRVGQVNRILLPLYVVHEHLDNIHGLTSGEVSQVTKDLGIPVQQPNASRVLSGTASKYVIGDKVRKKGQPVRYKLSRRGVKYFKGVLTGKGDGK